jgi:hypothetical protein
MVLKKKTRKALLGFVTTTSFILLVMVAPTTAAATASLQQQDNDNATTTGEPDIPTGPKEVDKLPILEEPIPDNENETDDECLDLSDDDPETAEPAICVTEVEGDDDDNDDNPETWINWVQANDGYDDHYEEVHDGAVLHSGVKDFKVDFQSTATDTGKGSHVDLKIDNGTYHKVASPHTFSITSYGPHTIYLKGVDKDGNEDETPAKFSFAIRKPRTYPPPPTPSPTPPPTPTPPPANDTTPNTCPNMSSGRVDTDKGTYKPGDIVGIVGEYTANIRQQDEDGYLSFRMYDSDGTPFGLENLISPKPSKDKGPCWLDVEWRAVNLVLGMPMKLDNGTVFYEPGMWKGVAEFGGSKSSFAFRVLPAEEGKIILPPSPLPPGAIITLDGIRYPDGSFVPNPWKMFGDRREACIDEIMIAWVYYLRDKAPNLKWYDFVRDHTKTIMCDSKDNDVSRYSAYTASHNVWLNWLFGNKDRPEVMIGTNSYDQENRDWNYWVMADTLVHESCHVMQAHDVITLSSIPRGEKQCHMAARDALINMNGPQDMIDWNQDIIDRYNGIIRAQEEAQEEAGGEKEKEEEGAQVQAEDLQKLQEDMKEAYENLPPFPTPPPEATATAPGNATIPEGPGEFGPVVPPPFVPDDNNQTQPGEEGSSRAEEE